MVGAPTADFLAFFFCGALAGKVELDCVECALFFGTAPCAEVCALGDGGGKSGRIPEI